MSPGQACGTERAPLVASAHIEPYKPAKPAPEIDSSGYRLGLARNG